MPITTYTAKPSYEQHLYGNDFGSLYFSKYSGLTFNPEIGTITKVTLEGRFGLANSSTSSVYIAAESAALTNTYNLSLNPVAMHFFESNNQSTASNIHEPFLLNTSIFSSHIKNNPNNFYLRLYCNSSTSTYARIKIYNYQLAENYSSEPLNVRHNIWVCKVEWEYKPTSATLPTSLGTSSSASSRVTSYSGYETKTLYWSGATGGQNSNGISQSPSGYEISGGHLGDSVYLTNLTYYTFRFPENLNQTYTYYLKVKSPNGNGYDSGKLEITLTTKYSNPDAPTNIKINNAADAYIGTLECPVMKLTWNKPSNSGENNSIASYTIYRDKVKIANGITQTSYQLETLTAGNYTVQAIGSIPNTASSISNAATLNYISEPSAPLDNNINISSINSPTLSWNAAKKNNGVKSINYFIYEGQILIYSGEDTSFYYDYNEHFNNDKSIANLSIFTRAYAKDGGYTQSSSKTITVTKISNFSIPSGFWNSISALFYSSTTVSWNKIDELDSSLEDRSPFKYELFFRSSSTGSWSNKGDVSENENAEFVLDATTIPEGNTIGYYMLITDKYGLSATSEIIETTKIIRPSIRNLQVTTNEQTFTSTFILQSNLAETAVKYEIYLHFPEGDNEEGKSTGLLLTEGPTTESSIISLHDVKLKTLQEKLTDKSKCYKDLHAKIITNYYSKPTVSYIVKAWYENFVDAIIEAESPSFQIDYAIEPMNRGKVKISNNYKKGVYNPEDIIQLYVSDFKLKEDEESLEGATADSIEHKIISNYSKKSYSENTDITIPSVSIDTDIGLYHVTTITYADAVKTYTNPIDINNIDSTIKVARWVKENIILESIAKSNTNKYTGYIILPEQLCSSLELENLQKIDLSANAEGAEKPIINFYLDNSSDSITTISGSNLRASTTKKIKVSLSTVSTSFNFTTTITWTNTSNKSFSTSTITFSYHEAAADFAIRKQRAGINVGDNFTGVHSELGESAATFEINHGTGMGNRPIVSITNNSVTGYIKAGDNKLILEGFELDTLPIASSSIFGVIKVGNGLNINDDGVLSASAQNYTLPIATGSTLGGVKIGSGISINNEGVISVETQEYQLPIAANGVIGGVTTTSTVTNSQGYVACPIINGIVYSPQIPVLSVNEKSGEVVLTAEDLSGFSDVAISGDYNDLINKPTIPTVNYPVTSVNGKSGGAVTLTYSDVEAAYKNHTHDIDELNGVATFRLDGTTLYITTNTLAG